jgi:hypothetical protein
LRICIWAYPFKNSQMIVFRNEANLWFSNFIHIMKIQTFKEKQMPLLYNFQQNLVMKQLNTECYRKFYVEDVGVSTFMIQIR